MLLTLKTALLILPRNLTFGTRMKLRDWLSQPGNTQENFAKSMGVTQSAVSQWLNWLDDNNHPNGAKFGAERAIEAEIATGGQSTRYDNRPDLFGPAPKKRAA